MKTNHPFDIAIVSKCDPHKNKCGDAYSYEYISNEDIGVYLVADGVGSCACDYKASKLSCDAFVQYFKSSTEDLSIRIENSIKQADETLREEEGQCKGMKSTLVVLVWDFNNNRILYAGIGDSRLYKITKSDTIQVTKDDNKSIIRKGSGGKPLIYAGSAVTATGVTNAIGAFTGALVEEIAMDNAEGLILATDGFYNQPNFDEETQKIFYNEDMEVALNRLSTFYVDTQNDDMTAMVIRKKGEVIQNGRRFVLLIDTIATYKNIIQSALESGDKDAYIKQLDDSRAKGIYFGTNTINFWMEILKKSNPSDGPTYHSLLAMLKASKL
jgi:serine/threonine protein phosphatase PrpC